MTIRDIFLSAGAAALLLAIGGTAAQAKPGGVGWQKPITITIPAGLTDVFQHVACPAGLVAINGAAFAVTNTTVANGFTVTGAGPRLDLTPPRYNEWAWNFEWSGGAADGSQIVLDVNCAKGPA